jgi:hypothetical protein
MNNPLLKKLQIKPGFWVNVINAPANFDEIIATRPDDVSFSFGKSANMNALLIFAITKQDMMDALKTELPLINEQLLCWILYPKTKSKLASDLNLMQSWSDLKTVGLSPCASAAIDETWTALRIKLESATKKSGLGNTEIKQNDYGNYIDVTNKIITLPEDLKLALQQDNAALTFYNQLSYSNRKEYLLWVLTAKQEKTRLERIQKTVDKLLAGKKNPSEK